MKVSAATYPMRSALTKRRIQRGLKRRGGEWSRATDLTTRGPLWIWHEYETDDAGKLLAKDGELVLRRRWSL